MLSICVHVPNDSEVVLLDYFKESDKYFDQNFKVHNVMFY